MINQRILYDIFEANVSRYGVANEAKNKNKREDSRNVGHTKMNHL